MTVAMSKYLNRLFKRIGTNKDEKTATNPTHCGWTGLVMSMIVVASAMSLSSCSKDSADEPFKPIDKRTVLLLTSEGVIYNQNFEQVMQLPYCTFASQIISEGDDYFVSGTYEKNGNAKVGYWKNGKWNTLHVDFIEDVDHWIYGIGKWDYYIYLLDYPNVLKNSGIFPIEGGERFAPAAQALAVSEGKCYVVGANQVDEDGFIFMPVLYTEHKGRYTAEFLPVPPGTESGECNSVYAYDVVHTLIGGSVDDRPVVWNDKQLQILPLTHFDESRPYAGKVCSVTVCDGHIYAAGDEAIESGGRVATLWRDNEIIHLLHDPTCDLSEAIEVMAYGNDVYVVTLEHGIDADGESTTTSVLWRNGEIVKVYPGLRVKDFTVL